MSSVQILEVAVGIMSIIAAFATWFGWRESHSDRTKQSRLAEVNSVVSSSLHPYEVRLTSIEMSAQHTADTIEASITRAMQPLLERMSSMESKMDFMWGTQKQLALDAAKILHQPDPRRAHVDRLLEAFMDDTLTSEEETELRKYLVTIRNWEPGMDVGFPVHPGEQTAAAILLRTLPHALTPRETSGNPKNE